MHAAHCPENCKSRACVNPNHLRWATPKENQHDRRIFGNSARKLETKDVQAIFKCQDSTSMIAKKYSIHDATVRSIKTGKTWGWATKGL